MGFARFFGGKSDLGIPFFPMVKNKLAFFFVLAVFICGCGRSDIARVTESSAAHLPLFEEFDRWARRICAADGEFLDRGTEAFNEAVFSPLRRDDSVLGAWVVLGGPSAAARTFGLRDQSPMPKRITWTPVRHRRLGEISVSLASPCPVNPQIGAPLNQCVLISRQARSNHRNLEVTVAFRGKD
jgi:hypothetical protein